MHSPSPLKLLSWLLLIKATFAITNPKLNKHPRQDGPVDPGTATDCTYYDTAYDSSYTCAYFEESWGLTHADFIDWNPSLKSDCSGLRIGNSYCVEVNFGLPRPTTTLKLTSTSSSSTLTTPIPTTTGTPKPSPTQPGLIEACTTFHYAVSGDDCSLIVAKYGTFTFADFLAWNPAVGSACTGLWASTWYCVGVPGTPTVRPTSTSSTSTSTSASGPTPTQSGIVGTCSRWHLAVSGDDCIPGTPTTTSSTITSTTATPTSTCNPSAPTPTQPTAICGCKKWHMVASGNSCESIEKLYGITAADFNKWNPNVGTACTTLWLGYYVCVGV
ncbi:ebb40fb2-5fe2-4202-a0f0-7e45d98b00a8 [Sclerotinia trifoliorum]|uniref:Ebb40fb2-5fe2-4202-a0f0-7e45d98b00a8 n=1 Tax=Sclerotinia trifoliorum TaxID=28548 RepID=A0A8H2ZQH1_9HELO|nr:ebb40fb2-5fe2-4202-a0f0-7e45d98b00a8 [Sclerotinia trifoliorum]